MIQQKHFELDAEFYLFFVKDVADNTDRWLNDFTNIYTLAKSKNRSFYIISPQVEEANNFLTNKIITIFLF